MSLRIKNWNWTWIVSPIIPMVWISSIIFSVSIMLINVEFNQTWDVSVETRAGVEHLIIKSSGCGEPQVLIVPVPALRKDLQKTLQKGSEN